MSEVSSSGAMPDLTVYPQSPEQRKDKEGLELRLEKLRDKRDRHLIT